MPFRVTICKLFILVFLVKRMTEGLEDTYQNTISKKLTIKATI